MASGEQAPFRLTAFDLGSPMQTIRPAAARRAWMDDTPQGYANRCLPLTIANAHGWEILCPTGFTAIWHGGLASEALHITGSGAGLPISHFGSGILTFHVNALFRTDPGIGLFVTGPINQPKDGIGPLTGIVETSWSHMTFTMNWRFTRPQHEIRFEAGEPFCCIFPIQQDLVARTEPNIAPISDEPDLHRHYRGWSSGRDGFNAKLKEPGSPEQAAGWQRHYHQGRTPDGTTAPAHMTKVAARPFRRG